MRAPSDGVKNAEIAAQNATWRYSRSSVSFRESRFTFALASRSSRANSKRAPAFCGPRFGIFSKGFCPPFSNGRAEGQNTSDSAKNRAISAAALSAALERLRPRRYGMTQ